MGELFRIKKMKKIGIYLTGNPEMGGVFQYEEAILNALYSYNKEYIIYTIFYNEAWKKYVEKYNFKKFFLNKNFNSLSFGRIVYGTLKFMGCLVGKVKYYPYLNSVSKKIDSLGLDLLIIPNQEIIPALIKTKSITAIHDLMHRYENFPENASPKEYKYRDYVCKNICEVSSSILVDSFIGKKQVIESYGEKYDKKIEILPYTIPPYLFESVEKPINDIPHKFIFYPAQFWIHKNHKNLLLAISKIKTQFNIEINMVFVGSKKNAYDEILNLIDDLDLKNQISILGYATNEEMVFLYRKARALIMPTYFGPTNIPPIEGMYMGCPVAVSNIYGMPEQVGDAGLKFNPNNIDEMADVLLKLWNDDILCKNLREKGFIQVQKYTQEEFNKKLIKIIEKNIKK